ncbi:MAG: hypothetical protein ACFFER_04605, partial [Candidatus Thorarchaeota archaeon]
MVRRIYSPSIDEFQDYVRVQSLVEKREGTPRSSYSKPYSLNFTKYTITISTTTATVLWISAPMRVPFPPANHYNGLVFLFFNFSLADSDSGVFGVS